MGWSPFGIFPDILMGKDPKKALEDAARTAAVTAAVVGTAGAAAPAAGATAAGATTASTGSGLLASAGQAMGAANMAKGLLSSPQQQAPQVSNHTDGGAGLSQLYGQIQQGDAQRMQEEIAKRQKLNGLFGGGNGWTA